MSSLTIIIKVVPQAGVARWTIDKEGRLKCYLISPPEKNKANEELIERIAKALGIAKGRVEIVKGHTARLKTVKVHHASTLMQFYEALGVAYQQAIGV